MVPGLAPKEASDRLLIYQNQFDNLFRKYQTYTGGEELFGLQVSEYPELLQVKSYTIAMAYNPKFCYNRDVEQTREDMQADDVMLWLRVPRLQELSAESKVHSIDFWLTQSHFWTKLGMGALNALLHHRMYPLGICTTLLISWLLSWEPGKAMWKLFQTERFCCKSLIICNFCR